MKKGMILLFAGLLLLPAVGEAVGRRAFPKGVKHVVVIGIDGLSVGGLAAAVTPNLDELARNGASGQMRVVIPSSSAPNWASMLMGATPDAHGVTSNDWRIDQHELQPVAANEQGFFPTVFGVARAQRPDADIAVFYHWGGIARLFEKESVTVSRFLPTDARLADTIARYIERNKPLFLFAQLDEVDAAGHARGHMTPAYLRAVEHADSLVGVIARGVREAGIERETLLVVISDHGGKDKSHGGFSPEEVAVPCILHGAGVRKGYAFTSPAYVYDLAPTVTFALGLHGFPGWRGKALREAFTGFDPEINPLAP
ncbi:MAG: alkaline phosphatase [Odoribacteraceae bacterium]|jgi:predicted AlkP superfamily pyrophosphatase or phosphodiesterase|nr:alkaline phosphatase [Odoribacteraceae bacterium]